MTIGEHTTVSEIASTMPSSVRVFQRHGIDFCCGGNVGLADACAKHGVDLDGIVAAIEAAAEGKNPDERDWTAEPLHRLIDHIVSTYHDPLREELPRLETMAAKVARVHGSKASHLKRVEAIVSELSADLRTHMRKEESILFLQSGPSRMDDGRLHVPLPAPIVVMEDRARVRRRAPGELRTITDGYTTPDWACMTFRSLYDGLAELESAMHVHVHLENNILFPRALALSPAHAERG